MKRFVLFAGTRPEIIKLRPVYDALQAQGDDPYWAIASQSPDLVPTALLGHDYDPKRVYYVSFDVENYRHPLVGLHSEITRAIIYNVPLDGPGAAPWTAAVVQGDTQTATSAALTCALAGIPVAHVEAGLRTYAKHPWPEEMNRKVIAQVTSLHLAPTIGAQMNLVREQVPLDRIHVTGQTGIDALHAILGKHTWMLTCDERPRIVVTCHRRENKERIEPLIDVLEPLLPSHHIIWPRHPNYPDGIWDDFPFVDPLSHDALVAELQVADLIITDSGGVIEEAAELEKPCLIIRDETERPEALDDGCRLVKRSEMGDLQQLIEHKLAWGKAWKRSSKGIFGLGRAGEMIAAALRGMS